MLLDAILPPTCLLCHARIQTTSNAATLCPNCWGALVPLAENDPNAENMLEDAAFESFYAPFAYNEVSGGLVHQLKYSDGLRVANFMARQMRRPACLASADLVVPVPLHPTRLKKRKYNQSAVLVREIAAIDGVKTNLTSLKRVRKTASQVGQSQKVRRKQLKNAFWADGNVFAGKNIVLVDDVCTTGSTAHWCAVALKEAGAEKVHVLTFAYVPPKL